MRKRELHYRRGGYSTTASSLNTNLNRCVNASCWFRRRWLGNISRQSYSLQQYAPSRQLSRRSLCRPATNTEIARRPTRPRKFPHPCYFTAASARSSVAREGSPIPQPAAGNSRLLHTLHSSLAEGTGAGRRPKPADCAHGAPAARRVMGAG